VNRSRWVLHVDVYSKSMLYTTTAALIRGGRAYHAQQSPSELGMDYLSIFDWRGGVFLGGLSELCKQIGLQHSVEMNCTQTAKSFAGELRGS